VKRARWLVARARRGGGRACAAGCGDAGRRRLISTRPETQLGQSRLCTGPSRTPCTRRGRADRRRRHAAPRYCGTWPTKCRRIESGWRATTPAARTPPGPAKRLWASPSLAWHHHHRPGARRRCTHPSAPRPSVRAALQLHPLSLAAAIEQPCDSVRGYCDVTVFFTVFSNGPGSAIRMRGLRGRERDQGKQTPPESASVLPPPSARGARLAARCPCGPGAGSGRALSHRSHEGAARRGDGRQARTGAARCATAARQRG